ncbi:hypothetical protein A2331_05625 [Candidatus Falkowbacteria bacterium RIFOXYB2_FULL_34_18]|uniref:Lipoprotein n=1 Tax=Candidatus Falkowbacteria bacterium RIFOXYD2_FULL_34_120 TaxID=1798007 RepID=A0A1F5TRA3_9BACT|nr:MAG: hypothetical protein A2331_05625 [Candidatus Falkowbacteria bacterium RIFOXYB2_FULL_34_18]OGF29812.1 MAG: hypothetical protein A2500_01405 [Candidatus Falkowbacteria bacterium RIFOXYC12_FULL_34_55]OGF37073.1 MAG: hypothetical protein A2466_05800 [Candidatus Falkowbacteria bacterium RIFOXYC2_FULL_34_220]OGF39265.1 MAG: hypothetical protein A2515_01010 [Candidatus Falkowbacteria bacterium RIFOXYD12_FULL_34_57]OGF41369.1 MAG: hypothetical protein A2531_07215 [Candidatus Falkowbacteria bact
MKYFYKFINFCILFCIIGFMTSCFLLRTMPPKEEMVLELLKEPIQTTTNTQVFTFDYRNTNYKVIPLAEYELWGLVVSHNDINKWYNIYHNKNSVNIKDLCIVWGGNIKTGIYKEANYKSGEWTCYSSYGARAASIFNNYQLSNNHLLSDSEEIREKIRNTHIGDQIHLKGLLVKYGESNLSEKYYRSSSMTRIDQGNYSCETIFVKDFQVLKKGLIWQYKLKKWSIKILLGLILLKILLFFIGHRKYLFSKQTI